MKKFNAWLKTRQAKFALYTFVYTLVVFAAVGVVNYLAKRYNKSYDSTSTKKFSLSEQTIKIAKNLNKKVKINYWSEPKKFTAARDLLDRYKNLNSNIDVSYIDAQKAVTQAIDENVKEDGAIYIKVGDRQEEAK